MEKETWNNPDQNRDANGNQALLRLLTNVGGRHTWTLIDPPSVASTPPLSDSVFRQIGSCGQSLSNTSVSVALSHDLRIDKTCIETSSPAAFDAKPGLTSPHQPPRKQRGCDCG